MIPAEALRVFDCTRPKTRVGKPNDGGYVIAHNVPFEGLAGWEYDHFLSGGIANENSFECGILDMYPNLICHAFDPSGGAGSSHDRYHFFAQPVEYMGLSLCHNALVKLDIERAEWPWLKGLTMTAASSIAQLVMELHSPHVPESGWNWEHLAWISTKHVLIHAHANNWDGIVDAGGARVPGTIECTWLRRDLAGPITRRRDPIPSPLDQPNDPSKPDHVVDWEPFIEVVP